MFKRLAPVIELSESCSESPSPTHKRSQTQHKARFLPSPSNSNTQVWQIIQSRRNLDKKMRLVKSRVISSVDKPRGSSHESPRNSTCTGLPNKTIISQSKQRLSIEKNKENKEKVVKKAEQARMEVKLQYAIDSEFIKKRNEVIAQQKREKVNSIRNGVNKKGTGGRVLKEVGSSDFLNRIQRAEAEKQVKIAGCRSNSAFSVVRERKKNERSLSVLVSPRYRCNNKG